VNFSIGTLDERVWRLTEPGTPHPRRRVEAMRTLAAARDPHRRADRPDPARALRSPRPAARGRRSGALNGRQILGTIHCTCARVPASTSWAGWPNTIRRCTSATWPPTRAAATSDPSYGRWLTTTVRDLQAEAGNKSNGGDGRDRREGDGREGKERDGD